MNFFSPLIQKYINYIYEKNETFAIRQFWLEISLEIKIIKYFY